MAKNRGGKPRGLKSPKQLAELAERYFEYVDTHPLYKNEVIKGGEMAGTIVRVPCQRPYLWVGLQVFLTDNGIRVKLDDYHGNYRNAFPEYAEVIHDIDCRMRDQKMAGATAGLFQHNIIARELGLTDNKKIELVQEQPLFGDK